MMQQNFLALESYPQRSRKNKPYGISIFGRLKTNAQRSQAEKDRRAGDPIFDQWRQNPNFDFQKIRLRLSSQFVNCFQRSSKVDV